MGPKTETKDSLGKKYHAFNPTTASESTPWIFEERDIPLYPTDMLLVRILIAKVTDLDQVRACLRGVPLVQDDDSWNCVVWVKHALEHLAGNLKALGTSKLDWQTVRGTAMGYCQQKRDEHCFDGLGGFVVIRVPTYDLLQRKQTIV